VKLEWQEAVGCLALLLESDTTAVCFSSALVTLFLSPHPRHLSYFLPYFLTTDDSTEDPTPLPKIDDAVVEGGTTPAPAVVDKAMLPATAKVEPAVVVDNEFPKKMPCRFRTAFILFSSARHKQIREQLGSRGATEKVSRRLQASV
jgi:hypothetical protein